MRSRLRRPLVRTLPRPETVDEKTRATCQLIHTHIENRIRPNPYIGHEKHEDARKGKQYVNCEEIDLVL